MTCETTMKSILENGPRKMKALIKNPDGNFDVYVSEKAAHMGVYALYNLKTEELARGCRDLARTMGHTSFIICR